MANTEIQLGAKLTASISRTLAELESWIISMNDLGLGDDAIRKLVKADIVAGGRVMGEFKNSIKRGVATGVGSSAFIEMHKQLKESNVKLWRWEVEDSATGPCPDCEDRRDRVASWEAWESIGLPQSNFSVCRENCYCHLEPVK